MRLTLNAAETGHLVLATMHSATCAEALSRICLSFPAELQGSVRAQLADCLVGVSCQRLDFLSSWQLRVPRCELLLGSSGARGTIRTGNFSQIATVLQSGAEDGMWSFARYQRWMEQMDEWQRPSTQTAAVQSLADAPGRLRTRAPAVRSPITAPPPAPPLHTPGAPWPHAQPRSGAAAADASGPPADSAASTAADVIELPAEEADLSELEQLARKLVERRP
jgi:twitching motility protein PilT